MKIREVKDYASATVGANNLPVVDNLLMQMELLLDSLATKGLLLELALPTRSEDDFQEWPKALISPDGRHVEAESAEHEKKMEEEWEAERRKDSVWPVAEAPAPPVEPAVAEVSPFPATSPLSAAPTPMESI